MQAVKKQPKIRTKATHLCPNCFQTLDRNGLCVYCAKHCTEFDNPNNTLPIYTVLKNGEYVIGKVLGQGGFGITYKAYNLFTGHVVAIKEFFPKGYVKRTFQATSVYIQPEHQPAFQHWLMAFVKEAQILMHIRELRGVVKMTDFFQENDTAYIVTNFMDGMPLRTYINKLGGRVHWRDALNILRPVFDSLYTLHDNGIIHNDISPENIMVVQNKYVKLIDFGAACLFKQPSFKPYVVLKKGYSPIESYSDAYPKGPWTDIYQAVATLFNIICADTPPEAPIRARVDQLRKPSLYGLKMPLIIENTILKALKVCPKDRYQTTLQLIQNLYGEILPFFPKAVVR